MTNKKIIIDVNKCKYRDTYSNYCLAEKDNIGECYTICTGSDCYYKQLRRKEQECEELKEYIETNRATGICEACMHKAIQQNDYYRQALKSIKAEVKWVVDNREVFELRDADRCQRILTIINRMEQYV